MAADPVFIDTNVLVYASRPSAAQHFAARSSVDRLQEAGAPLWISPQVLREYVSVVTRPQASSPSLPMIDALSDVRRFIALFNIAQDGGGTLNRLIDLLGRHAVGGKQVHDAQLVATMLEAGVHRLLTFNARDFERLDALIRLELP